MGKTVLKWVQLHRSVYSCTEVGTAVLKWVLRFVKLFLDGYSSDTTIEIGTRAIQLF